MDQSSADKFMCNLVKNIQRLCHGHLDFNKNVEVIGHLYLNIDSDKKLNYIVNETCSRVQSSTLFVSNSFYASPGQKPLADRNSMSVISNVKPSTKAPVQVPVKRPLPSDIKNENEISAKKPKIPESHTIPEIDESMYSEDNPLQIVFPSDPNDPPDQISPIDTKPEITNVSLHNLSDEESCSDHIQPVMVESQDEEENIDDFDEEICLKEEVCISEDDNVNEESFSTCLNNDIPNTSMADKAEYTIVEMGTKKGRPLLVDSAGYSYSIRRKTNRGLEWTCTIRNKTTNCRAGVIQLGDAYKRGKNKHIHDPKPGLLTSSIIVAEARAQAHHDSYTPTSQVVERAMTVKGTAEEDSCLPKQINLKRMINRYRQVKREITLKVEK